MTPGVAVALLTMMVTALGLLSATFYTAVTTKRGIAKENANRRIVLEEYVLAVDRYHRGIRAYLFELANDGVIDIGRVDESRFRPPPVPKYNGNGK